MSHIEHDSLGEIEVADDVLWGAQTQRAKENFDVGGPMPNAFIRALALVKVACADANRSIGKLPEDKAKAIIKAGLALAEGQYADQFPVDVYQTGSGTSSNMNANEVIAHLCAKDGVQVHPNDDVNHSQSSNDTIPTTLHVAGRLGVQPLLKAVAALDASLASRADELRKVVKPGRTHLMDAMPITFGQVLDGWREQLNYLTAQLKRADDGLGDIPQGGTAVGTGINCPEGFREAFSKQISQYTGLTFRPLAHPASGQSAIDRPLALSAALRALAVFLVKVGNDFRWMNSGPLHGMSDITLPVLQPGSSIMPGKVNPVACESVVMAAMQIQGLDHAIALGAQTGNFQLNVNLPLVANNLLTMLTLATNSVRLLQTQTIDRFEPNHASLQKNLARNPILVTALNTIIGYEKAAHIAHVAYDTGRAIIDVAEEETDLSREELEKRLDPINLVG